MNRTFPLSVSLSLLAAAWAAPCPAKKPAHFVPANLTAATDIPYPSTSLDAGVVTLSIALDNSGQVTAVSILRDIPSVSALAIAAVRSWTYAIDAETEGISRRNTDCVSDHAAKAIERVVAPASVWWRDRECRWRR